MPQIRFGIFEARLDSGELYKHGRQVRVQQQPFEVLRLLVTNAGDLVTREALRKHLWPDGVTVDFEQSLNKSVTKLRDALGDTAANPRFIETLPKRGYRFIAPVSVVAEQDLTPSPPASPTTVPTATATPTVTATATAMPAVPPRTHTGLWYSVASAVAIAVLVMLALSPASSSNGVEARGSVTPTRAAGPRGSSPIFAARDAYARGRVALARRSPDSLRLSVEHFTHAVALSPRYADAYVGLSEAWSLLSSYGRIDPREAMPRARDAANRALALDPQLARAYASLGRTAMIFDWDWPTAEWHFERAIALQPGDNTSHQWYAYFLSATARHDDAIAEARRAVAAEPLSLNANTALGYVLYVARRYDEAALQLERTLEIDPEFTQARRNLAFVRVQQGRLSDAVAALERVAAATQGTPIAQAELAWAHARAGARITAQRLAADLDRSRSQAYVPPDAMALVALGLEARDEAVAWLQRAVTMRIATLAHLPVEPIWDPLRTDERVTAIVTMLRHD